MRWLVFAAALLLADALAHPSSATDDSSSPGRRPTTRRPKPQKPTTTATPKRTTTGAPKRTTTGAPKRTTTGAPKSTTTPATPPLETTAAPPSDGCTIRVNGDLGDPKEYQPVYLRGDNYLAPEGSSGVIRLKFGEKVTLSCPGNRNSIAFRKGVPNGGTLLNGGTVTSTAACISGTSMSVPGVSNSIKFSDLVCYGPAEPSTVADPKKKCYDQSTLIQVGFTVTGKLHSLYESCFNEERREVLYVKYKQTPADAIHQAEVPRPKSWSAGNWYPGFSADNAYNPTSQKKVFTKILGADVDKYLNPGKQEFFTRGHLAAKSDFVFATNQRTTFWFINAAPQWEPFNNRNWDVLEVRLRERIATVGYDTVIYTGTWNVLKLRDNYVYLREDRDGKKQIPIPLYFYKVVYDEKKKLGTVFVGINNPWIEEKEIPGLTFCEDRCRNNANFRWLFQAELGKADWDPDNIKFGYSFCCEVKDFAKTVPHLPNFQVNGLLF